MPPLFSKPILLTFCLSSFPILVSTGPAQEKSLPAAIRLWEGVAPGSEGRANEKEKEDIGPGKCNVTNVHQPSITPFLPTKEKATGTAVLIAPGGGHRMLCLGHEGYSLGAWFAEQGIAAFVLKYRLAKRKDRLTPLTNTQWLILGGLSG